VRRIDPLPLLAGIVAALAGYAAVRGAPAPVRVALGLPLVTFLPGYALSKLIFGARLRPSERLLLSVALSLAIDILGGLALSLSTWGLTTRSWAVLLGGLTCALALVSTRRRRAEPVRWKPPRGTLRVSFVAALCAGVTAVAIAADRRPEPPPSWATGYTLFWLLPQGQSTYELGLQSGEFEDASYRVELRVRGRLVQRWSMSAIAPSRRWTTTVRIAGGPRLDAYLYRVGAGKGTPYRHVFLQKKRSP
jgi:hypothetical protein